MRTPPPKVMALGQITKDMLYKQNETCCHYRVHIAASRDEKYTTTYSRANLAFSDNISGLFVTSDTRSRLVVQRTHLSVTGVKIAMWLKLLQFTLKHRNDKNEKSRNNKRRKCGRLKIRTENS